MYWVKLNEAAGSYEGQTQENILGITGAAGSHVELQEEVLTCLCQASASHETRQTQAGGPRF